MNLLTVAKVSKSFGDQTVLNDVSLQVGEGDKIGLVGPNGAGKTTLLEIIAGRLAADAGSVALAPACTIGYLTQSLLFDEATSIADYLGAASGDLESIALELRELEASMAHTSGRKLASLLERYDILTDAFDARGGYNAAQNTDEVLTGLGLGALERTRSIASLSGGEKARLGLAATLLQRPDLFILDEPTNHLDFEALKWLEEGLARWAGGVLVVSHDRRFLDNTVRAIVEIDGVSHTATRYAGNYSAFALEKTAQQERMAAAWEAQQEEIKQLRDIVRAKGRQVAHNRGPKDNDKFIPVFKGARVDATVARNVRAAEEKLQRIEADPLPRPPRPLVVNTDFDPSQFGSKLPLGASDLTLKYGERVILDRVSCNVGPRTRAVIVGANGAGKSTLLKLLAGVLAADDGRVSRAPGVILGYLEQEQELLETGRTVYEHFARDLVGDWETLKTELMTTNLFTWPELSRPVEALSVGQKRKVQIARLLAQRANVLLLDEPTNHISLDVLEEFEQALTAFAGPIVAVSHDRRFIERFGEEIWEIKAGHLRRFLGWDEYIANA